MKKLFLAIAAVTTLLTSCSKDDAVLDTPAASGEQVVTFEVSSPELDTRYGEGEEATTLEWFVYEGNTPTYVLGLYGTKTFNKSTTVTIKFIQGRTYHVLFWAHEADAPYEVTANGTTAELTVDYDALTANQESYDAFYNFYDVGTVTAATQGGTVLLTRPFAQLNVGTSDTDDAIAANLNVTKTGIEVKTYEKMNFMTGEVDRNSAKTTTFTTAAKAEGTITANGHSYDHISMNYLLVNAKERVDVKLFLQEDNSQEVLERVYTSIPVERNHRTNILGTIYTQPADFTVVIDDKFTNDYYEKWDGKTYDALTADADGFYSVSHAAEFAWILENVKEDVKIRLEADINFGGNEIPVFADKNDGYNVILEGNGNRIFNFKNTHESTRATLDDQVMGLFNIVNGAEVSNLTIEGAEVDAGVGANAYAGVLFGRTFSAVKLTNVTVKDSEVAGTNKVGGLIGFVAEDQNDLAIENCHVIDTNITTHDMASESGLAGGLIGYIAGGKSVISNSSVKGGEFTVINSTGDANRANSKFIGGVGSGKVELINCSIDNTGMTYTETGAENYTSPYGDFIGGNQDSAEISMNNINTTYNGVDYTTSTNKDGTESITISASEEGSITIRGIVENNTNVTSVVVEEGVTTIGNRTFRNCSNLESVTLPSTLTKIDQGAFQSCTSLTKIEIPTSVTTIGENAFYDCKNLESINIPNGITRIEKNSFRGLAVTELTIPASVTFIGDYAFRDNYPMTKITILSESLESIGSGAFLKSAGSFPNVTIYVKNETVKAMVEEATKSYKFVTIEVIE